jgi:hypothetical protein
MLAVPSPVTRPAEPSQVSNQSSPTFKDSLLALSKPSSDRGTAHEAGANATHRQSSAWDDTKLPITTPHVRPVLTPVPTPQGQQQVLPNPQLSLIGVTTIPMQLSTGGSVLPPKQLIRTGPATRDTESVGFSQISSNTVWPAAAKSSSVPLVPAQKGPDAPQIVAILPVSQTIPGVPNPVVKTATHAWSSALPNSQPITTPKAANSVVTETAPSATPDVVQTPVPDAVSSAVSRPFPKALPGPVARVLPSLTQMVAPTAVSVSAPTSAPGAVAVPSPMAAPAAVSGSTPIIAPTAVPAPSVPPSAVRRDVPTALPVSVSEATQSPGFIPTLPLGIPALNADPPPALHSPVNAPTRGEVVQSPSPTSTGPASPPPASDPAASTVLTVPGTTADQLTVMIQSGGPLLTPAQPGLDSAVVAKPTAVLGANGTDVASNAINNPAGVKQHPQPADQTQSQTGSQDATSSAGQNQPVAAQQEQGAAPVPASFASHIANPMEHAPNGGITAPPQTSAPLAAHRTEAPHNAAPAGLPPPPALPVINTARLIQNIGQSEMRVGMRSSDFGNISISTSATRDVVSAQISLEHSELARTLAVHLPEMQARLGSNNQAMNVRIDLNGPGTGTSSGMSNGSADGSRGDRQQKGSAASTQAVDGFRGQGNSVATATVPTGEGRLDARLDITA